MPRSKTTHAGVKVSRRDDESVEHGLDLVDEVRDGRLLRLRGRQVRVPLRQRLRERKMVSFIFSFKCVEDKCIKASWDKDIKKNLVSALVESDSVSETKGT